jgi:hypothetical protein
MRWGLSFGTGILIAVVAIAACDNTPTDTLGRYYVAPDGEAPPPSGVDGSTLVPIPDGGDATTTDAPPSTTTLDLPLDGWWRAGYAASPWAGTTSTGTSATQNLTQATNPPTVGPGINTLTTALFNGVNSTLVGGPMSTFATTTTFSGFALVNIKTINTDNPAWPQDDTIFSTLGTGEIGVYLRDNGLGTVSVGLGIFAYGDKTVSTTIAKNTWQLVQWRGNGTEIGIRVNGGAWATTLGGTLSLLNGALELGRNPFQNNFLDGMIADIGFTKAFLQDPQFEAVRAYVNGRYALGL